MTGKGAADAPVGFLRRGANGFSIGIRPIFWPAITASHPPSPTSTAKDVVVARPECEFLMRAFIYRNSHSASRVSPVVPTLAMTRGVMPTATMVETSLMAPD